MIINSVEHLLRMAPLWDGLGTTVSLVARTLQTAGLIRSRRGSVEIVDGPGLEEASCECYATIRGHYRRLLPLSFGDHS